MKIEKLEKELSEILAEITASEDVINSLTQKVHPDYKASAKNLIRYLILRSYDLRKYHNSLSDLGVSSLRSGEGYVYSDLSNVIRNLNLIKGTPFELYSDVESIGYTESRKLLKKHSYRLFSKTKKEKFTEIMVTLPDEAAENRSLLKKMVKAGMQIARINLGKGDPDLWKKMVKLIREVSDETGKRIKIYMDLAGPKIRTSPIEIIDSNGEKKNAIAIKKGDHIILAKSNGRELDPVDKQEELPYKTVKIGVTLEELIDDAKIGDAVYFDDGTIQAKVIAKQTDDLELVIHESYKSKIGSLKGINVPNTRLSLPALTEKDKQNLAFVCANADIVGYSFVRTGSDVKKLYQELDKYEAQELGVVFKIETRDAFENLPDIILEGMRRNKIGIMIARGDLAVEVGFERISEVQNQILWICEAAHIPVIWATQVLENLAKKGIPTRAEISDAALSVKAECVMLNKGPKIILAIKVLKNILKRMQKHSFKKKNELRPLHVAQGYIRKTFSESEAKVMPH